MTIKRRSRRRRVSRKRRVTRKRIVSRRRSHMSRRRTYRRRTYRNKRRTTRRKRRVSKRKQKGGADLAFMSSPGGKRTPDGDAYAQRLMKSELAMKLSNENTYVYHHSPIHDFVHLHNFHQKHKIEKNHNCHQCRTELSHLAEGRPSVAMYITEDAALLLIDIIKENTKTSPLPNHRRPVVLEPWESIRLLENLNHSVMKLSEADVNIIKESLRHHAKLRGSMLSGMDLLIKAIVPVGGKTVAKIIDNKAWKTFAASESVKISREINQAIDEINNIQTKYYAIMEKKGLVSSHEQYDNV